MPLVKVEIRSGKTPAYKRAVLDGIHRALVTALGVPEPDRYQRLHQLDPSDFEIPPGKTDQVTLIEILLFPGRPLEVKKKLYEAMVTNLGENPGIDGNDITIVLHEPPLESWGLRSGKPASELDFGVKKPLPG